MSVCKYKAISPDKEPERWEMMQRVESDLLKDKDWNLLSLTDIALTGSSLEAIQDSVPFRRHQCRRSLKCCGVCTRQCSRRCIQDSLNRLYTWRKLVEVTPEGELENLPLGIRLIVNQEFDSAESLAWAVGDIISRKSNTDVQKYMKYLHLHKQHNPNKVDYSAQPQLDEKTGKRIVDPASGQIKFRLWPESGLCPFCLADNTLDRRFGSKKQEVYNEKVRKAE